MAGNAGKIGGATNNRLKCPTMISVSRFLFTEILNVSKLVNKTVPKRFYYNRPELEQAAAIALRTCVRTKDHQRLIAMRLAASGQFTAAEIAKYVQISRRQFFLWVAVFKKHGLDGLLERKHGGGAPSKLSNMVKKADEGVESKSTSDSAPHPAGSNHQQIAESAGLQPVVRALIEILHHNPKVYGINRSNWTLWSLAEAFGKQYGQRPSISRVGQLLKGAGLRWKKSRQVLMSPDPKYKEKVELLLKTLQSLKADEDLFFIDEMGPLAVRRHGGRCYTPKEETPIDPKMLPTYLSLTTASKVGALPQKQAVGLIKVYGNLDSIFPNLAKVASERIRQKLQENEWAMRDLYAKCRVEAVQNLGCNSFENCSSANLDTESNRKFLREYGFYSLVRLLGDPLDDPF